VPNYRLESLSALSVGLTVTTLVDITAEMSSLGSADLTKFFFSILQRSVSLSKRKGMEDYFLNALYLWAALGSRFFNRSEACFLSSRVEMPS
jgi:hypothetical protein